MRRVATLVAAALTLLLPSTASQKSRAKNSTLFRGDEFHRGRDKTLYGADNRLEESQVRDAAILATGAATAALVRATDLSFNQNTRTWSRRYTWTLDDSRSQNGGALCSGQRYATQQSMATCSGTLIGPDLWATAGHCIANDHSAGWCRPGTLDGYLVVFDFTDAMDTNFPEANVFDATEVVHCVVDDSYCYGTEGVTVDWAVLRLDRAPVGRTPVTIQSTVASVGDPMYLVGHPSGLPRKYTLADAAEVLAVREGPRDSRNHANVHTLVTNLDSFSGNSGSGMFNGVTNEMVGILVEGGQDWEVQSSGCSEAHTCNMDPIRLREAGCPGEESVSATVLLPFLLGDNGCASDADCNAGVCDAGACVCNADYHGPDCSFKCDRGYCNNRGTCVGYDQCDCDNDQLWPPLCSVDRRDCTAHIDCESGAYCALLTSGSKLCWECSDCEAITCERWGDSIDNDCGVCSGTAPPQVEVPRGDITCGELVTGSTTLATSQIGEVSGENMYTFMLDHAFTVHFDSCNSGYDTFLRVMSEDLRTEYAQCDDCGPCGTQSVLDVGLAAGAYVLVIEGYEAAEGPYEVQMTCINATEVAQVAETVGSCACMPTWTVSQGTCDDTDATYHGCHAPPCDGDTGGVAGQSWCMVETTAGCSPYGANWDYCIPGTWRDHASAGTTVEELAANSCGYAYDDECDVPMYCAAGTDTFDCASGAPAPGADSGLVPWDDPADSCRWANDGECDDLACSPGTDTTDCSMAANFTHVPFSYVDFDGDIVCDGAAVTGTTEAAGSHVGNVGSDHVYFFNVTLGTVNIQFDSCESDMDTFLRVMDHELTTEFAACDDCGPCGLQTVLDMVEQGVTLDPGSYALVIEGYSNTEGHYSVNMHCEREDTGGTDMYDGRVECGDTVEGDTSDGMWQSHVDVAGNDASEHIYLFTVGEGGIANIEFDSCASEFDTWLLVMTPDLATEITGCDDCGPCDTKSVLETGPMDEGEYALVIEGWSSDEGRYSVTMTCQTVDDTTYFDGAVDCGGTVSGITTGAPGHSYTFTVPEPGLWNVEFDTCGASFDTHLSVFTVPEAVVVSGCDDCGPCGEQAVLDTGFLKAGDYAVSISSTAWRGAGSAGNSGPYMMSMLCFTDSHDVTYFDGDVECGDTIIGDTTGEGSHRGNAASDHLYSFEILDGGVVNIEFDSCGSEFDTHLRVLSHDLLTEVASCDDCGDCAGFQSILDTGSLDPGGYVLVVEGYGATEGIYNVTTTCANTTAEVQFFDGNINCGDLVEGDTMDEGSHRGHESGDHIYYFTVPVGETINVEFDSCASGFDTHLRVFDHGMYKEYADCDDCGGCGNKAVLNVVLEEGEYALLVEGYWWAEGAYAVQMTCTTEAENSYTQYTDAYFALLLGDGTDMSGNGLSLTSTDHAHIGIDGAAFDGAGDDITITNFEYASDGTFSVSFWFTKEVCGSGIYEYLYSHHESADPADAFDLSFVNVYLGCEENGGGWSTAGGTVIRYFVKDTVGTEATFDFALHDAGEFNALTNVWVHTILTVSPTSMSTYDDGQLIDDNDYGTYMTRAASTNAAMPEPFHLDPHLTTSAETGQPTFDLQQDITIGGRTDRNADRHFHGRMALVSVYSEGLSPAQAAFSFRAGTAEMEPLLSAETVREEAWLDVWFVDGQNQDQSVYCHHQDQSVVEMGAPCHSATLNGHAALSESGVSFDGDEDDVTFQSFDYYSDGSFGISFWFTKERCTAGVYEYLFSHHMVENPGGAWDNSYVDSYIGCETNGGGYSSAVGTVIRHWIRDESGTEATFDYSLHLSGDFDAITNEWIHNIVSVSPTGMRLFNDGSKVNNGQVGFSADTATHDGQNLSPQTTNNAAYPTPDDLHPQLSAMSPGGAIFNLLGQVHLGGRADGNMDRHFHGRMAMVRIYDQLLNDFQANVIFRDNEALMLPIACDNTANYFEPRTFACTPFAVPPCECPDDLDPGCQYELLPQGPTRDRLCDLVRQCDGAEEFEERRPTATVDRRCQQHQLCPVGEYESVRGTATRDSQCSPMRVCDTTTQFESQEPAMRPCRDNLQCLTSDRECTAISRVCDATTEFEDKAPTLTADRVCQTITTCGGDEYEVVAPTTTTDRECALNPGTVQCDVGQYMYDAGPPISCRAIRTCSSVHFEVTPPTDTNDRVCRRLTTCRAGFEIEITPPTLNSAGEATSDRVCGMMRSCVAGEYDDGINCLPLTVCLASQYEDTPPQPDSDRHCTPLRVCLASEFESNPPTTRRDRVCLPRPTCMAGHVEIPGGCEECPAGTEDADSDSSTPCTLCADGTSSVAGSTACSATQFATVQDAFQIDGAVVPPAAFAAAVTDVVTNLDSQVTVEVVSYQQTVTTSLQVQGRPLSDFNQGTPEGTRLISELRNWIATALNVPSDSVQLQTQRRRLREVQPLPLRRVLAEKPPGTAAVVLQLEVVADRDVTGRMSAASAFDEDLAGELGLPATAVTAMSASDRSERFDVSTEIVTRVNFEADGELDGGGDRAAVSLVGSLLSSGGGQIVEEALRRQDPQRYADIALSAEAPDISFAETGAVHMEGELGDVLQETRPAGLAQSHDLHDMDGELTIIEVFFGFLGVLCLCACLCVGCRRKKPKLLTDDDLDAGFGALGGGGSDKMIGTLGDSEMSDGGSGGGGSAVAVLRNYAPRANSPSDHNPLVVRAGDDAAAMGTFENRLARP